MAKLALAVLPLLLAFQCEAALERDAGGGMAPDADVPIPDGGATLPGTVGVPATDVDGSDNPEGFFGSPPDAEAQRDLDAIAACYDDPAMGSCEGPACRNLGACCVGQGDCCSATSRPDLPPAVDLRTCADLSCLGTAWRTFGLEAAFSPDGLTPQGTATGEGGVVAVEPLPLHNTRAAFTFTLTPPEDCGADCLETLSVGLLAAAPPLGAGVVVQPAVALTYSGSRDTLALVLSGRERLRFGREGVSTVTLTLEPSGRATVAHGETVTVVEEAFAPGPLHPAVWGRTRNPGASDRRSVALTALGTELALCDMPQAWDTRQEVAGVQGTAPSLATDGVETLLAFVDEEGAIRLARRDGPGRFTPLAARLEATNLSYAEEVDDPELVFRDDRWELFFTARGPAGAGVGRAILDGEAFTADSAPLLEDAWAPTLAASLGGRWLMVVRTDEGLQSYVETDSGFVMLLGSRLGDALEGLLGVVGRPSLVLHDRAWHLYVPVRRGTRWSVELLASEEALVWRHVGPTLSPSGQGFDRLGVLAADAMALGDRVEVVYEGDDGVRRRLGWASRAGTRGGRR